MCHTATIMSIASCTSCLSAAWHYLTISYGFLLPIHPHKVSVLDFLSPNLYTAKTDLVLMPGTG